MPGKPGRNRPRCIAITRAGDQCQGRAAQGSRKCAMHGGARRKVGAPTKINVELITDLTGHLRRGVSYEVAAQAVGIHRSTIIAWRERGEHDLEQNTDSLYAYFADEATRAIAGGEATIVDTIRKAGRHDWRALAWLLERRHPSRWARRDRLDVDVDLHAAPRVVTPDEPDRRAAILDLLRTATAPPPSEEDTIHG